MSDLVVQSCRDDGRRAAKSMHSYQSVWMAHWTRTSCREAPHGHNHISLHMERNDGSDPNKCHLLGGLEIGSDTSTSTKGFTEVEARTVRIMNEDTTRSSKNLINEKLDCQPFPTFKLSQNMDSKDGIHISLHRQVARHQIDCNIEYDPHTTVSKFQSVLAVALSAKETLSRECHFQCGGVSRIPQGPANTSVDTGDSSLALAGPCQENITGSIQKVPYRFNRGKTPVLSFKSRQAKFSQLSSVLAAKEHVSNTNFTSLENENDNYDCHSAFLACEKKLDDHSASENFGTSFSRQSNASLLLHEPPGQRGLKLQLLGSSTDSEAKDNIKDIQPPEVCLKNESSAETDVMDMDNFKMHNNLSGINPSPSNKLSPGTSLVRNILLGQNLPFQAMIASAGEEVECRWAVTRLPGEIPTLPAAACSKGNTEPGTSRTQSLDAEHLLSHAERPSNPKHPYPNGPPRLEPGSRWLKRLRLSDSVSVGHGTKCSILGEAPSKLFSKIMTTSKSSSSGPVFREGHDKDKTTAAQTAILLRKGESSALCSAKKDQDILLSHSWIQRWCHNRASRQQKKPEVVVVCEPLISTKVKFDEHQTKKFPSIAAMALMEKAMSGFQPCEFRRRGSFVVWNTKDF